MAEQFANGGTSTLSAAITSTATSLTVVSAAGFSTSATFRLQLTSATSGNTNVEIVEVTAVSGATFTVTRAAEPYNGVQTAYAWNAGDFVAQVLTAGGLGAVTPLAGQIVCEFSGGGVPPSTGVEQDVVLPFTGTLTGWQIAADRVGSATIDVWMAAWTSYPPTSANDITGGTPPALASAASAESTSLTGWTTAITAGDVMRFQLAAVATVTRVLLVLTYTRL